MSYHRRKFPHDTVQSALIGNRSITHALSFDTDYLELCGILDKVLPRHKSFAPTRYYVKIFFLIALAVGLEVKNHGNQSSISLNC